jgi:hypothetical protein
VAMAIHVAATSSTKLMLEYLQILCNRFVSCLLKTKFQSNLYDEGI